ncbi:MAG: glycosyltransferase [Cyclobacteriaceae bacterium]
MTETSGVGVMIRSLANGGAEKQSILLAKALQARYNTFLVILDEQPQHPKHRMKIQEEHIDAVFLSGHMLQKLKQLIHLIRQHHLQHLFCFLPSDTLMATLAARFSGTSPIVYGGIRNDRIPWRKKAALKILHNYVLDYSISNCHAGVKNLVQEGFEAAKFIVIHNALEEMPARPLSIEKEEVRIVTVGRFVAQKGYERALRIMQKLRNQGLTHFQYTIIGYGGLETEIRQMIAQLELQSHVQLLINPGNVLEQLSQSDIYLCTSSFEGLSNAVMEAMSCGLPVVATEVGDNNYLVIPQKNGYLHAVEDLEGMTQSLARLIQDTALRTAYGAKSQAMIREHFTFAAFQQSYFQLLDSEAVTT